MEVNGLLEEVYGVRRDMMSWESANQTAETSSELFFSNSNYDDFLFDQIQVHPNDHQTSINDIESYIHNNSCPFFPNELSTQFYPLPLPSSWQDQQLGIHSLEAQLESCNNDNNNNNLFNIGTSTTVERKASKKVQGQPSKNLMAERRRRKRLNDRLSMLRSIVPKISKMDRTSILGDTIDYMKELLERIQNLRQQIDAASGNSTAEISLFKDIKPNEVLVRNSPKFEVDRKNLGTKIEISCAGKPGLLYSTVTTLEALGLEIQQCVISCFNDFAMQAYCSEDLVKKTVIGPEEVKQALFKNAGYGGRCL